MRPSERRRLKYNIKIIFFTLLYVVVFAKALILFTEEKNLYLPDKVITSTPRNAGVNYESLYFRTDDRQSLNGWFVPAKDAGITILYCRGRGGNLSDNLPQVKFFHEMGVNFFVFDYRGYGNSSGRPSEKGLYKDAQAAYDYLMTRKDVDKNKMVAYGKSLGGPVAANLCLTRKLAALIVEGSFPSLRTYVGDVGGLLPIRWLVSEKFDAISKMRKIHIPKLIVHGMDDEVITFPEGRLLFNEAALPKEFLPFDGTHDDSLFVTSAVYKNKLNEFFLKYHIS